MKAKDKTLKILILIIFASIFEFVNHYIDFFYSTKADKKTSPYFFSRIHALMTIISSLLCTYSLNYKSGKHHKISLIFMSSLLIIIIFLEIYYITNNYFLKNFLFEPLLVLLRIIIISFIDCIEKYLAEADFMNPFKIIMCEGIIMFVMAIIISIGSDPLKELRDAFKDKKSSDTALIIFLVTLLFILSIVVNVYKVYCNAVYSPMARSLAHFIINPLFNILYFFTKDDFSNNILCLIISEIICIATDFFAFVYNEYLILFCCDLEVETVDIISERASLVENIPLNEIGEEEEEEEEEEKEEKDDNKDNINKCKTNKKINNNETVIVLDNYSFSI